MGNIFCSVWFLSCMCARVSVCDEWKDRQKFSHWPHFILFFFFLHGKPTKIETFPFVKTFYTKTANRIPNTYFEFHFCAVDKTFKTQNEIQIDRRSNKQPARHNRQMNTAGARGREVLNRKAKLWMRSEFLNFLFHLQSFTLHIYMLLFDWFASCPFRSMRKKFSSLFCNGFYSDAPPHPTSLYVATMC